MNLDKGGPLSRAIQEGWDEEEGRRPAKAEYELEPCVQCNRPRVELLRNGQRVCEKCETVQPPVLADWQSAAAWLRGECARLGILGVVVWWEEGAFTPPHEFYPWRGSVRVRLEGKTFAGAVAPGEMHHFQKITPAAVSTRLRWRATDLLVSAIRNALMGNATRLPS